MTRSAPGYELPAFQAEDPRACARAHVFGCAGFNRRRVSRGCRWFGGRHRPLRAVPHAALRHPEMMRSGWRGFLRPLRGLEEGFHRRRPRASSGAMDQRPRCGLRGVEPCRIFQDRGAVGGFTASSLGAVRRGCRPAVARKMGGGLVDPRVSRRSAAAPRHGGQAWAMD